MAGTLFAVVVVGTFHVLWACGLLGEQSGFAMAADVDAVTRLQLEDKLDEVYTIICTREAVDEAIADRARSLQAAYRAVNKNEPYSVDCELLRKMQAARTAAAATSPPSPSPPPTG